LAVCRLEEQLGGSFMGGCREFVQFGRPPIQMLLPAAHGGQLARSAGTFPFVFSVLMAGVYEIHGDLLPVRVPGHTFKSSTNAVFAVGRPRRVQFTREV
jgi:hypothetical protein